MLSKNTRNRVIAAIGVVMLGVMLLTGFSKSDVPQASETKAKNVIYLIADGMSDSVITATRYYKDANDDGVINNSAKLAMDDIRCGFVKTSWANGPITDSAPAGTALSSGYKTNPGYLGVDTEGTPNATVLEAAELKGLSTGLIATSEIMHATPAAFSSHDSARSNYNAIMKQQVYGNMEVVLGAGDKFFQADGGGKRSDGRDLTQELKDLGYDYVTSREEMNNSSSDKLWGMFAPSDVAYEFDREEFNPEQPSLVEMTEKAIEVLGKNEEGFFLMIEGSKIDWAAHANNPSATIGDVLAFDSAVQYALDYAKNNDDTIVVVTTDHANSGFSIGSSATNSDTNSPYDKLSFADSVMQLKDFRLGEEKFTQLANGKSDGEVAALVEKYYGFTDLSAEEMDLAKSGKINLVLSKRAKIGYTTGGHTGGDVYLGVWAPAGINKIKGTVDNTDLAKYIEASLELDLDAATEKLFSNAETISEVQGSTYEINLQDKENPIVEMKKDNVELNLHVNSDVVEVKVDGKDSEYKQVSGVTVLNAGNVYATTDEINEIFTVALEENKINNPTTPEKPSNPGTTTKPNNGNGTSSIKLPNTGAPIGSGTLVTLALSLVSTGGYLFKRKNNR